MRKPIIALTPLVDQEQESVWMLPGYLEGIIEAGGIPVMLPLIKEMDEIKEVVQRFDGFIITGGHDVDPKLYHEEKKDYCGALCKERDEMEMVLIPEIIKQDKPMMGICRGYQIINVCLGGSLYQDLDKEYKLTEVHRQLAPYDQPSHEVMILKETPLYHLLESESMFVNSCHHQAIKELSSQLLPMAYSSEKLVEAFYMPNHHYIVGYQWHPEMIYKKSVENKKIFKDFIKVCQ